MREGIRNRFSISLACLLGFALLLSAGTALAKKPVPPDPDPDPVATGVVYFEDADGGLAYVPADDSADPTTLYVPAGEISSSKHGDEYWVLYAAEVGGSDPDKINPLRQLFVEAVDGMTTPIQLTDYDALSLSRSTYDAPVYAWGPDDDTVVFVAVEWANDGDGDYATGAGIYEIALTWAADGNSVTAGSPVKLAACAWRTVATGETFFRYGPSLSWSPDGTALTTGYYDPDTQETVVVTIDLTDGDVTRLVEGAAYPTYPLWSVDGDWIYYDASDWSGIRRVSVDGVDDEEVLDPEDSRKFTYDAIGPMHWAPDGGAFAYRHKSVKLGRLPQDSVTTNEIAMYDLTSGQSTILCEGVRALAWRP